MEALADIIDRIIEKARVAAGLRAASEVPVLPDGDFRNGSTEENALDRQREAGMPAEQLGPKPSRAETDTGAASPRTNRQSRPGDLLETRAAMGSGTRIDAPSVTISDKSGGASSPNRSLDGAQRTPDRRCDHGKGRAIQVTTKDTRPFVVGETAPVSVAIKCSGPACGVHGVWVAHRLRRQFGIKRRHTIDIALDGHDAPGLPLTVENQLIALIVERVFPYVSNRGRLDLRGDDRETIALQIAQRTGRWRLDDRDDADLFLSHPILPTTARTAGVRYRSTIDERGVSSHSVSAHGSPGGSSRTAHAAPVTV